VKGRWRRQRLLLAALVVATALGLVVVGVRALGHGRTDDLPATTAGPPHGVESVVGLGDSVMAGSACGCAGPAAAYAALMSGSLGWTVDAVNLGVGGATTASLARQLRTAKVRAAVARARVVLVIIGANDLLPQLEQYRASVCDSSCYDPAIDTMAKRLDGVLDQIAAIRKGRRGTVLVSDYWNVFQDGSGERARHGEAEIRWSRGVSRVANRAICKVSAVNGAVCVDTYDPFFAHGEDPDRYLAADGDHPNKAGVALIAEQLQKATPKDAF